MTIQDFLKFALEYSFGRVGADNKLPINHFHLNPGLQYRLCEAFDNLMRMFGEVTRKDIALLIEAWVMAQGNLRPDKPIRHRRQPSNMTDFEWSERVREYGLPKE